MVPEKKRVADLHNVCVVSVIGLITHIADAKRFGVRDPCKKARQGSRTKPLRVSAEPLCLEFVLAMHIN